MTRILTVCAALALLTACASQPPSPQQTVASAIESCAAMGFGPEATEQAQSVCINAMLIARQQQAAADQQRRQTAGLALLMGSQQLSSQLQTQQMMQQQLGAQQLMMRDLNNTLRQTNPPQPGQWMR